MLFTTNENIRYQFRAKGTDLEVLSADGRPLGLFRLEPEGYVQGYAYGREFMGIADAIRAAEVAGDLLGCWYLD